MMYKLDIKFSNAEQVSQIFLGFLIYKNCMTLPLTREIMFVCVGHVFSRKIFSQLISETV